MGDDNAEARMTTTNKEKLISVLLDHQREMAEMGVQRLAVFGSYVRGEATYVPLAS